MSQLSIRRGTTALITLSVAALLAFAGCVKDAAAPKKEQAKAAAPAAGAKADDKKAAPAAAAKADDKKAAPAAATGDKVKVEFYVMSKCPFGVKVEDAFKPVLDKIGASIDFHLEFIVNEDANQPTGFSAMHGEAEVKGNIWQLCARKHYPDNYKWMGYVACTNKQWRQIPQGLEECAGKDGFDAAKMKACAEGQEGKDLLKASMEKAKARSATGSPTIYVNNERYSGGRTENDFMRGICNSMKGAKPEPCAAIPEPKKVNAIVLTDARCKTCNSDRIVGQIKGMFPGLSATTFDYTKDDGKAKYTAMSKTSKLLLPAILFDNTVKEAEGYARVQRYVVPHGEWHLLRLGAKWDPTSEICDNKKDDTGNGKVDCADSTCAQQLVCREEKKKQLDVFVMSQCPFGVRALDAMDEVLKNFGDEMDFNIHFIADEDPNSPSGFRALHGEPEVRENIRELCAIKHYAKGRKYMEYVLNDVIVSSVRPGGSSEGGEALPLEEASFNYGKIEFIYTQTDHKTGKPKGDVKAHWDLVANKGA